MVGRLADWEEGRVLELGLIYKMRKDYLKKNKCKKNLAFFGKQENFFSVMPREACRNTGSVGSNPGS